MGRAGSGACYHVQIYDFISLYGCQPKNFGTPKWMVKIVETPIKMDDLGGPPLFLETPIFAI